jgi:transcription elongation factor GreA-like protein
MSEQEKIDIIRVIREELQSHRDYADVKYATNVALNQAKEARDVACELHRDKLNDAIADICDRLTKGDKQFLIMIFAIIGVGAIAGLDNLIPLLLKMFGLGV